MLLPGLFKSEWSVVTDACGFFGLLIVGRFPVNGVRKKFEPGHVMKIQGIEVGLIRHS